MNTKYYVQLFRAQQYAQNSVGGRIHQLSQIFRGWFRKRGRSQTQFENRGRSVFIASFSTRARVAIVYARNIVLSLCTLIWHAASSIRQPVINNKLASGGAVNRCSVSPRCNNSNSELPAISPRKQWPFCRRTIILRRIHPRANFASMPRNLIAGRSMIRDFTRANNVVSSI